MVYTCTQFHSNHKLYSVLCVSVCCDVGVFRHFTSRWMLMLLPSRSLRSTFLWRDWWIFGRCSRCFPCSGRLTSFWQRRGTEHGFSAISFLISWNKAIGKWFKWWCNVPKNILCGSLEFWRVVGRLGGGRGGTSRHCLDTGCSRRVSSWRWRRARPIRCSSLADLSSSSLWTLWRVSATLRSHQTVWKQAARETDRVREGKCNNKKRLLL